jgi:tetratricopeptide (TPR) repeat protein
MLHPLRIFLLTGILFGLTAAHAQELAPFQTTAAPTKDLRTQLEELRTWASREALPALASTASQADPKFPGVVGMGTLIATLDFSLPLEVEKLTFRNSTYWRGVMEMSPGNQLVAILPALLFAANGETDKAQRMLVILRPGAEPGLIATNYLNALDARLQPILKLINSEIARGITLHDEGKYPEAIAIYESLLALNPGSAWAQYELFFSRAYLEGTDAMAKNLLLGKNWEQAAPVIYRLDPLYTTQASAKRGVSMASMFDRMRLGILFKKQPPDLGEMVGTYADLATRLEAYGFAAHLYWSGMGRSLKGPGFSGDKITAHSQEDIIARFLYCLEKLGVTELKQNFKGNFPKTFKKFDKELLKHRTQ